MAALVQIMAWRPTGKKPLSEPVMVRSCIYVSLGLNELMLYTPRNMHIACTWFSVNWTITGSDNGSLSFAVWHQAISWTNAALLSDKALWTNLIETWIQIQQFSMQEDYFKMLSLKWHTFCQNLNMFTHYRVTHWNILHTLGHIWY